MKPLHLFYDVVSPYSWIAFETLCRYSQVWKIQVHLRPFQIGRLLQTEDGRFPNPSFSPHKRKYVTREIQLLARHFRIPIRSPEDLYDAISAMDSRPAVHLLTAVQLATPAMTAEVSRQVWLSAWSGPGSDISRPVVLLDAMRKAGLDDDLTSKIMENSATDGVARAVKTTMRDAESFGVFENPTIVVPQEERAALICSSARFHILADILGEKYVGPLSHTSVWSGEFDQTGAVGSRT